MIESARQERSVFDRLLSVCGPTELGIGPSGARTKNYSACGIFRTKEDTCVPFSLIPQGVYPSVTALEPEALAAKGIRLVLADLDGPL